jgi:hypothetical protein
VGHSWVKQLWIQRSPAFWKEHRIDRMGLRPEDFSFTPALAKDNPILMRRDPGYVLRLEALPEYQRRALLYGEWDLREGAYFMDFAEHSHVIDPRDLPFDWRKALGLDYGKTNPFAGEWVAADDADAEPRLVVYGEHYRAGATLGENVRDILSAPFGLPEIRKADPSMWGSLHDDTTLAEQAANAGLDLDRANNSRVSGWALLSDLLRVRDDGLPGILFMRDRCPNLIRELTGAEHSTANPDDIAKRDDHALDALRYAVVALMSDTGGYATEGSWLAA